MQSSILHPSSITPEYISSAYISDVRINRCPHSCCGPTQIECSQCGGQECNCKDESGEHFLDYGYSLVNED